MTDLYLDPWAVAFWTAIVVVSFALMLTRVLTSLHHVRTYRRELAARARTLRISNMVGCLGTDLSGYLRRTRAIDVERHLLVCRYCRAVDRCDQYLAGNEGLDARAFCPNLPELVSAAGTQRTVRERRPPNNGIH